MSQEIEIKVPLTENQYEHILNLILKKEKSQVVFSDRTENLLKSDEYYSRYKTKEERKSAGEPKVIRLRTEKNLSDGLEKAFFTIKKKSKKDGIEFNDEQETFIENPEVLRNFFEQTGFSRWFTKTKKAVSAYGRLGNPDGLEFHVEAESVNGLLYIEIEYTKDDAEPEKVKNQLEAFVRACGADPEKKDSRSWVEIISEKQKQG